jgi:tRNA-dihydrouridine synthase A
MMDWTDRHFRYLLRRITRHTLLYTEMVTATAVLHGDEERLLGFDPGERPLALQLGGDDPVALAEAARRAEARGFDEIDLNVGCPSPRVVAGNFGASLMTQPEAVARMVDAMRAAVALPVTVKHRIGVDDLDGYDDMARFVRTVAGAGADAFIVHARKAWLEGLSPRENRSVPPLRHAEVVRLKQEFPQLTIELNGGVRHLDEVVDHLRRVDGVMLGRAVYEDPLVLAGADARVFAEHGAARTRRGIVSAMLPYLEQRLQDGVPLQAVTRHMLGLFRGVPGGKRWRRHLSEHAHRSGSGPEVVLGALETVPDAVLDAPLGAGGEADAGAAPTRPAGTGSAGRAQV